jgi:hypothetical protein
LAGWFLTIAVAIGIPLSPQFLETGMGAALPAAIATLAGSDPIHHQGCVAAPPKA